MSHLEPGKIVWTKSASERFLGQRAKGFVNYKAKRGKYFVTLLLTVWDEYKPLPISTAVRMLNAIGWVSLDQLADAVGEKQYKILVKKINKAFKKEEEAARGEAIHNHP